MGKPWGDPAYACRMPPAMIAALKMMARDQGRTTSEIIRELIEKELHANGYEIKEKPIPGQMRIV